MQRTDWRARLAARWPPPHFPVGDRARDELEPLIMRALVGICGVTELEILHYDRDFDTIARFTEQPTRWIVPPGTV